MNTWKETDIKEEKKQENKPKIKKKTKETKSTIKKTQVGIGFLTEQY